MHTHYALIAPERPNQRTGTCIEPKFEQMSWQRQACCGG